MGSMNNEPDLSKRAALPDASSPRPAPVASRPVPDLRRAALFMLVALSMGFLGGWLGTDSRSNTNSALRPGSVNQQVILNESQLIGEIAKEVGPSTVSVNVTSQQVERDLFGFTLPVERQSAGTGVIISADGHIVTNRHVIPRGTTTVSVTLSDGTELTDVEVIGRTNDNDPLDVAFLRVKDKRGKDLKPAKLGDSSKVRVGDRVVAIGNALGQFQNTVTSGIISGYGRNIQAGDENGGNSETLQNLLQTDASINQGNSGGPLVNISGEVIAINTAVAGGAAENIGFAIPINDVQGLIKSVLEKGQLLRPYLGVRYIQLTDDYAYQFNLNVRRGAYIAPRGRSSQPSIIPGSPADKAGLQEKDVIVKVNDIAVDENNSLASVLGRFAVDDTVKLTINRGGQEQTFEVKLEAAPTG